MAKVSWAVEAGKPVDLALQRLPTAKPEGETVAVTLPVFVAGISGNVLELQVAMNVEEAEQLHAQLRPAITQAKARIRMMGG